MSPSSPFILRPVATSLLMLAIVLAGLVGFKFLPLSALPQVDYPTIQVQTLYPGASPEVMAQTVTAPLERNFGQMAGLQRMSSTSAAGVSIVRPSEANARLSAWMRTAGRWPPASVTRPTPFTWLIFSARRVSTMLRTSVSGKVSEVTASVSTGASAGFTLA